ncbi:hypothetical protein FIM1_2913 [Kluyveromyces marxianus]|uniref:Uncharacterized protein n=1 Tax=Kluyveromyces marxianus TaxID=4911 RepID=A0ABX6EWU1_KLUMA|nr:hypothetical protein FIM1_2913 [Kluyveromyces marxianus]
MTRCQSAQNHLYKDIDGRTDKQTNREEQRGTEEQTNKNEIKPIKSKQTTAQLPSSVHRFIVHSFIHSFIHSFMHSPIHSFIHSFIPTGPYHSLAIAIALPLPLPFHPLELSAHLLSNGLPVVLHYQAQVSAPLVMVQRTGFRYFREQHRGQTDRQRDRQRGPGRGCCGVVLVRCAAEMLL